MDEPRTPAPESRWLVQGPDVAAGAVARWVAGKPEAQLLSELSADLVVVTMPAALADDLRRSFAGNLMVEPDGPLSLFPHP